MQFTALERARARVFVAAAAALALAAGACDAQVTSSYQGERMVEIRSNIVNEAAAGDAEAALLWWAADDGGGGGALATPVTTEGVFPDFTLSVHRRAPDAALIDVGGAGAPGGPALVLPGLPGQRTVCRVPAAPDFAPDGGRLAIATVAAVGADGGVIGLADGYALLYVASGTALAPGYHLMRVEPADASAGAGMTGALECDGAEPFLRLRESEQGVDGTEIEIHIGAG
jgi:hypothetical protein